MKAILLVLSLILISAAPVTSIAKNKTEIPEYTVEGLKLVPNTKNMALVWAEPGADLSQYDRVYLVEPYVAFKKDWQIRHLAMSQNMGTKRVTGRDMDRIKSNVKELFMEVFTEELERSGYILANERAEDVLIVKPAIIDLDVEAPYFRDEGINRTYVNSAGAMAIYLELYDSETGDLLVKAVDTQTDREKSRMQWQTEQANRAAGIKMMRPWAVALVNGLDQAREVTHPDEQLGPAFSQAK